MHGNTSMIKTMCQNYDQKVRPRSILINRLPLQKNKINATPIKRQPLEYLFSYETPGKSRIQPRLSRNFVSRRLFINKPSHAYIKKKLNDSHLSTNV